MSAHAATHKPLPPPGIADWRVTRMLTPYLWEFKGRVLLAMALMIGAKIAAVTVPLVLKHIVDGLSQPQAMLAVPVLLIVGYGLLRFGSTLFSDLRDIVFGRVTQRAIRRVSLGVFQHLHALSLRFHLERQTGGITRDLERGARAISSLVGYLLFRISPTVIEILMVAGILFVKLDGVFAIITVATLAAYIYVTVTITEWRTQFRRRVNELDSQAYTQAIDSLLNYETVKYFSNERVEAERYDANLAAWEDASMKAQVTLTLLNAAQAGIIALGVTLMLIRAANGVVEGLLTIGDLVMVNAYLLQMFQPLNFLGVMYREIKQSLTDVERLFKLLSENLEVKDAADARQLQVAGGAVRFDSVSFAYDPARPILHDVSFTIPSGRKLAVVGHSGSGKSTLARLLFRFYDVRAGSIGVDGQDVRGVTQDSLRAAMGVVPQDTVLFNDSIYNNIAYGRVGATREQVVEAARAAHILAFIESLPDGWETVVGERGLKLSGGEKQRVAIARTLLKDPAILILDEATSALDTRTEKAIQAELLEISRNRTSLVIAHRLSTIVDADEILVMDQGRIVERGTHEALLAAGGHYARMWEMQQAENQGPGAGGQGPGEASLDDAVIPAQAGIQ
jgi:ATP-binding cassette subfamily B protein